MTILNLKWELEVMALASAASPEARRRAPVADD
jgi:hypothetical protein